MEVAGFLFVRIVMYQVSGFIILIYVVYRRYFIFTILNKSTNKLNNTNTNKQIQIELKN